MVEIKSKKLKIGDIEVADEMDGWEIVTGIGTERWLGLLEQKLGDGLAHPPSLPSDLSSFAEEYRSPIVVLRPALELSCPSRTPVLGYHPTQGMTEGVISGFDAQFTLNTPSSHPVVIKWSSRQRCSDMSEELRLRCFMILAEAQLGPVNPQTGKREKPRWDNR